jgi:hypothetical protein
MSLEGCIDAAGLAQALKPGLQALGANSTRVQVLPPARATNSVNLDASLTAAKAPGAKWDYGIGIARGQRREVAWVEVHTATSSEVSSVLNKLAALRAWLRSHAPHCTAAACSFHWVATDAGVHIDAARRRKLNAAGLRMPQSLRRV